MLPTDALAQMATVAATVTGLREAQYPATGQTPKYPSLVLLWGDSEITHFATEQYWDFNVRGLLLTGLVNETRHHVAEVDPLIAANADKLSPANPDGFLLRRSNGDICDGCQLVNATASSLIEYGGQQHYGANLTFNVKLRRFPT